MINLCLPMKVIRITQRSGGNFTHPNGAIDLAGSDSGVDFCYAVGNFWRCISGPWGSHTYFFTACDAYGNAVPVHCADEVCRIVTMALTHSDFTYTDPPVIGKIYKSGEVIYSEGMYGKATGNHVHLEIAEGLQYGKYYDEDLGVYRMQGELIPENVFFICDSFSTVANMGGTTMRHCAGTYYQDPETIQFADGYQEVEYLGQKIHVYKQSGKEKIGLVSCEYGTAQDIRKFALPGKKIKCVVNANYFEMGRGDGFLGRVQGFKNGTNEYIDARPASPEETGMHGDKPFIDLVLTKDGFITFGDMNSWDYPINEVVFGTSPAGVEIANGLATNKYSPECGYSKITDKNTQTMLMRCSDGKFALGVVSGKLTPIPELRTWGLIYGLDHLSIYDSGGSSQMIVDGQKKVYTGRKIPVVLIIYEDEESPVVPDKAIGTVHCELSGMHIRECIGGTIMRTVRQGEDAELLGFVDGIQSDGYQWIMTKSGDVKGFSQLDTAVLWVSLF